MEPAQAEDNRPSPASACLDYAAYPHWISSLPLDAQRIELSGSMLVAGGSRLSVVDVANPAAMREVASIPFSGSYVSGVAVLGPIVFATYGSWFGIFDTTTAGEIHELGRVELPERARSVRMNGLTAYVACGDAGVVAVNATEFARPRILGRANTPGLAIDIAVQGTIVFVIDRGFGITIVDFADPLVPAFLGFVIPPGTPNFVVCRLQTGRLVVARELHLDIYDVLLNPARATYRSTTVVGPVRDVALSGQTAYVTTTRGLTVVDIAVLESPRVVYTLHTLGTLGVAAAGEFAFASGSIQGLLSARIQPHERPAGASLALSAARVTSTGSLAYVAEYRGLTIVDSTLPLEPRTRGFVQVLGDKEALAVDSGTAYLIGNNNLTVVDVTDADQPVVRARIESGFSGSDIAVVDSTVYIASNTAVAIVDVTVPQTPREVGRWMAPWYVTALRGRGSDVYAVGSDGYGSHNLWAIDVSDRSAPRLSETIAFAAAAHDIALDGEFAYVALGSHGMAVVRLGSAMAEVARLPTINSPTTIAVRDGIAYLGADNEILAVDVHEPTNPRFLGQAGWERFSRIEDLTTTEDALVAAGSGVVVFPLQCAVRTPVTLSEFAVARNEDGVSIRAELGEYVEHLVVLRAITMATADVVAVHAARWVPAGAFTFEDHDAPTSASRYALRWTREGRQGQTAWIDVAAAPPPALHLSVESANPAHGSIAIRYHLPNAAPATLEVFTASGRRVRTLENMTSAGAHRATWNGNDDQGRASASGVYFVRLQSGGREATVRLVRLARGSRRRPR